MEFIIENRPTNLPASKQATDFLRQIRQFVRNEVCAGRKFTLRHVADHLALSEYNINKALITTTGDTLKSYVAKCRSEASEARIRRY
jgi:AraC-like DNA-binding protein